MITERVIRDWAEHRDAEAELPLLLRRLIGRVASVTAIAMPGGDAVSSPGLDGDVIAEQGNAWVPNGRSCWELGRSADPSGKADDDFNKRTAEISAEVQRETTFVFVTPRRWNNKDRWRERAEGQGAWRAVRVYDARDLEHWLEETPAVALWFANLRGIAGTGVEAPDAAWSRWADQATPVISEMAFLAGREEFADDLAARLRTGSGTTVVAGDSREELAAFAVAVVRRSEELRARTAVVTSPDGWRFVDANPDITIAIAATEEAAQAAVRKQGRVLVVPRTAGGFLTAPERKEAERLPRPQGRVFRDALVSLGLDSADADRLTRQCGRSWAVWRRLNASNPAIRHPHWLDRPEARVLSTIVLIGAWDSGNINDREIVSEISGRDWNSIEADLRALVQMDDPPVLSIGRAWRAKAPLELLHLWGGRLTADAIDRFLICLQRILEIPDPVLELEKDRQWAAGVYGKVRRESGTLIKFMLDSLIKLAVQGVHVGALAALQLDLRVARLVENVLGNADRIRWLSVSSFLSELAEAAPDAFLRAIEQGLRRDDNPVAAIIAETASAEPGTSGRCWHADLLWALERLAWAPQHLARVADILARLATAPKQGNWGNTPLRSLTSLFRSWWPQVTTALDRRLVILDRVVRDHPDVGWKLLVSLSHPRREFASPNAAPVWRDDDSAPVGRTGHLELVATLRHVHSRMIELSPDNAFRIGNLIENISQLHPDDEKRIWELVTEFSADRHTDEERELLCGKLRRHIYWHLNFDKRPIHELGQFLERAQNAYQYCQPRDMITRYRWLFASDWFDLPEPDVADSSTSQRRSEFQRNALSEILEHHSWEGVTRLARSCGEPWIIGDALAKLDLADNQIVDWVRGCLPIFSENRGVSLAVAGLIHNLDADRRCCVVDSLVPTSNNVDDMTDEVMDLLQALPFTRETWERIDHLGEAVAHRYWETTKSAWCRDASDREIVVERLLAVGRPCAAISVLRSHTKNASTEMLARVLTEALSTTEPVEAIRGLDRYVIQQALERLATDSSIEDDVIIRLEFGFAPMFRFEETGKHRIHRKLSRDPGFFVELLNLVYRSENEEEKVNTVDPSVAERAYDVLNEWRWVPGAGEDGNISSSAFSEWVRQAMDTSVQQGHGRMAQITVGHVLAHAPADPDGIWPCVAVRDVLDNPAYESIRLGLHTGLFNKRGITSRAHDEGGEQERALSTRYRSWADALASTHWRLAGVLKDLADGYDRHARDEDSEAAWRGEE